MNILIISQIIGTISIGILFIIEFYIAINKRFLEKTLRTIILWTSIYVFFLFTLRLFSLLNLGTREQLQIISGFTATIPLVAVIVQLFLQKKIENGDK